MKTNELRIGNFVKQGTVVRVQEEFARCRYSLPEHGTRHAFVPDYDLEPLPITDEWLQKLGFSFLTETDTWINYTLANGWGISKLKKDYSSLTVGRWYYKDNYYEVETVHQLQNLYYALTRTELETKITIEK